MKIFTHHLLSQFLRLLFYLIILFIGISLLSDFFRDLNIFLAKSAKVSHIVTYLLFANIHKAFQLMPVSALVATLFSISAMVRGGEFTAIKVAGVNVKRAISPLFILGFFLTLISFVATFFVIPPIVSKGYEIKRVKILGMEPVQNKGMKRALSVALGSGARLQASSIDIQNKVMFDVILYEYDENFSLTRQIFARKITWKSANNHNIWILEDGFIKIFKNDAPVESKKISTLNMEMSYSPDDFAPEENLYPEEMNFSKHISRIRSLKNLGLPYRREEVEFHSRIASCVSVFMVLFLGTYFGLSVSPRHGKIFGFVTALMMAFLYYGISALGQSLGENGVLPTLISAWLGNITFGLIGIWLFTKIPT